MDNTSNSSTDTIFGDIIEQNLPPEAAAALKQYEEAQSALPALNDELRPLLKASPLDMDAIRLVNEKKRKLKQQRMDALEILALYSDEAFNELQATIERGKAAERIVYGSDEPTSAKESAAELKRASEKLNEIRKSISTTSKEKKELEQALEELKQVSEELSN
jgi:DNA repair exonuclease SbcCD ATPase subunit